jgi:hypothetical protein
LAVPAMAWYSRNIGGDDVRVFIFNSDSEEKFSDSCLILKLYMAYQSAVMIEESQKFSVTQQK